MKIKIRKNGQKTINNLKKKKIRADRILRALLQLVLIRKKKWSCTIKSSQLCLSHQIKNETDATLIEQRD